MSKPIWIMLSPILLAACGETAHDADNPAGTMNLGNVANDMAPAAENAIEPNVVVSDANMYIARAGAGDLFEIESSRAILAKTSSAEVKAFAEMMIQHHGQSTDKIKAAAQAADITAMPPVLSPAQQQELDAIKAASGKDADRLYIEAQRKAHDEAMSLHRGYAAGGDTPQLKAAAAQIVPVIQQHVEALAKMTG